MSNFKVLPDTPISDAEADRFGYKEIAGILVDVIKKFPTPFTIGLYGRWGVGKTSICKLVKEEIDKDREYKVFYFDAWKYEKDSFRRQFLIELDEDVFKGQLKYREKLNQTLTIPQTIEILKAIKKSISRFVKIFISFVLFFFIFVVIKLRLIPIILNIENYTFKNIFEKFIDLGFFIGLGKFILEALKLFQGSVEIHRTDSAEGFEHFYKQALKKLNKKRLVIIIDNLDRLKGENAVKLLGDVKTFLANDKDSLPVIFLIPCDNNSIINHLHHVYGENFDADEFLRKFFNLTFRIPKFLDLELDKYILEKLKETNIQEFNDPNLAFVIMHAFRDNPREIIQFINSLIVVYLLAKSRRIEPVLNNIPFLAKVLVIRQKWPKEYVEIENIVIRTGKELDEVVNLLDSTKRGKIETFLDQTSSIQSEILDPFFSLIESEYERQLPEAKSFILSLEEKRYKDAKDIYNKIKKSKKVDALNIILKNYVNCNKDNITKIHSIFIGFIECINSSQELQDFNIFLNTIFSSIKKDLKADLFSDFKWDVILDGQFLNNTSEFIRKEIIDFTIRVLETFNNKDIPAIGFENIFRIFKLISKKTIYRLFKGHEGNLEEIKKYVIKSYVLETEENKFNDKKIDSFVEFIENTNPLIEQIVLGAISKYHQFLSIPSIKNRESKWRLYESTNNLLDKIQGKNEVDNLEFNFNNLVYLISNEYNATADWNKKSLLVNILIKIKNLVHENYKNNIINILQDFIPRAPIENIRVIFEDKNIKELLEQHLQLKSSVINRANQGDVSVITEFDLGELLADIEKLRILTRLLDINNFDAFIKFSDYLSYKIEVNTNDLVKNLINKLKDIEEPNLFERLLNAVKKWGIPPDSNFGQVLIEIKALRDEREKIITKFVKRNKKLFGEPQLKELLK